MTARNLMQQLLNYDLDSEVFFEVFNADTEELVIIPVNGVIVDDIEPNEDSIIILTPEHVEETPDINLN